MGRLVIPLVSNIFVDLKSSLLYESYLELFLMPDHYHQPVPAKNSSIAVRVVQGDHFHILPFSLSYYCNVTIRCLQLPSNL